MTVKNQEVVNILKLKDTTIENVHLMEFFSPVQLIWHAIKKVAKILFIRETNFMELWMAQILFHHCCID